MTYLVFPDQTSAQAAADQIAKNMGMPIMGINAETGDPDPAAQETTAWDTPRQILDASGNPGGMDYKPAHPLFATFPNQWEILYPDAIYMTGVTDYKAVEGVN
jgi:hypothetical protein